MTTARATFGQSPERQTTAQTLPPCTVLSGDETLLLIEAADALRSRARSVGCTERTHMILEARSDWSGVLSATRNVSLFGDQRLLEISVPTGKPGKTGGEVLQQVAAMAANGQLPDAYVLIQLPALDRTTRQSKWAQALGRSAQWVDIPTIQRSGLPSWIRTRLEQQGYSASPDTLAWLAEQVEGNLLAANQELQKLMLLHEPGELTLDAVQAAVLNVARYNLFDLRDAAFGGEGARALTILDGLCAEGVALPLVLWALGEETRILNRLAATKRESLASALRGLRIFGARERLVRTALARTPATFWPQALAHVQDIDCLIKGIPVSSRLTDPWGELARLTTRLALAGAARP